MLFLLLACADPIDQILALDGDASAGADVYAATCAQCHAEDGTGGVGPDLTQHLPHHADRYIVRVMIEGSGDMEPQALTDQEAADALAHVRATFGEYEH